MDKIITFRPYKVFDNGEDKFIFNIDTTAIYKVDDKTLKIAQMSGNDKDTIYQEVSNELGREQFDELIEKMESLGFIVNGEEEIGKSKMSLGTVTLMLIQGCNMRCSYCYADGGVYNDAGTMDLETACAAVEFLIENGKDEKSLGVILFGGEPLLAFPLLKKLVPYIRKREKEIKKRIYINMTTNGTLLNQEVEEFFDTYNIHAMISIDGDKETHDKNRFFADKTGSYDVVINRTEKLRHEGKLSARATVNGKQNLVYTFEHLYNLGFKSIAMSPAYNTFSEEDYDTFLQNQINYVEQFLKYAHEKEYSKCKQMKIVYTQIKRLDTFFGIHGDYSCGAGRTMVAVDYHGDMYPCHRFVSYKQFVLGNIYKGFTKRNEFLDDIKVSNHHEKCKSCWVRSMCLGNCPYSNFEDTGHIGESKEKACETKRATYEKMVEVYLKLSQEEKKQLFE